MYADHDRLIFLPFALDECHVLKSVACLAERNQTEVSVFCRHIYLFAHLDERFLLESVLDHILDRDNLEIPFLCHLHQLWKACHGSIFVHDLHKGACRIESCHSAEVDGSLGMSASSQYAVVLCIEWIDVARATECLWGRCRISECLDGLSTVVG